MESAQTSQGSRRRRSQRIPLAVPLMVTSLDPAVEFAERCETVSISSHGCLLRAPRSLEPGTQVRLDIPLSNRTTTARVVAVEPVGPLAKTCEMSLELLKAENFWGIRFPPEDWTTTALSKGEPAAPEAPSKPDESAPALPAEVARPAPAAAPTSPPAAAAPQPSAPAQPATPPAKAEPVRAAPPVPPSTVPKTSPPTPAAPAAIPPAAGPQARAKPLPPPSPGVDEAARRFEPVLREKAKAIAAEFESSYRESLGDLLVRLRADLEARTSADWERLRTQAEGKLQEMALQLHQQVEQDREGWRQESAQTDTQLQSLRALREEAEARLQSIGAVLDERVGQEREQLLARGREELERLADEVRQQLDQQLQRPVEINQALEARIEEINKSRDYLESLIRAVPQTFDQSMQQAVAGTLERVQTRIEEEFSAQREGQVEQLEHHLLGLADQVGADFRQKMFEDLDRNERDLLDRINVRLEEMRALETTLRQYAGQMSAELASKSEQLQAELAAHLERQLERRQGELNATLEEQGKQLQQRAETVFRNLGGQSWNSVKQRLQAEFDQRQQELRQALETARTESARLQGHAEKLSALMDSDLEKRLEQALADVVGRAREHMEDAAVAARENHLKALHERAEESLAPLVSRSEATADDLHQALNTAQQERARLETETSEAQRVLDEVRAGQDRLDQTLTPLVSRSENAAERLHELLQALQQEHARLETQSVEFRREMQQVRASFAEESEQFQKLIHDALVEASGQIRGRLHLAVEMAQEPVDRMAREASTRLEELSARKMDEMSEQVKASHERLSSFQSEMEASLRSLLDVRVAEVLARFQEQAEKLAGNSTAELQTKLNDTLESMSRVLREKLGRSS